MTILDFQQHYIKILSFLNLFYADAMLDIDNLKFTFDNERKSLTVLEAKGLEKPKIEYQSKVEALTFLFGSPRPNQVISFLLIDWLEEQFPNILNGIVKQSNLYSHKFEDGELSATVVTAVDTTQFMFTLKVGLRSASSSDNVIHRMTLLVHKQDFEAKDLLKSVTLHDCLSVEFPKDKSDSDSFKPIKNYFQNLDFMFPPEWLQEQKEEQAFDKRQALNINQHLGNSN